MLGLTTVAKYKSLEKRCKELENLNSSLLEDKTRKTNRIVKLEKDKRDLIEENSGIKIRLQELNEFNLKLQETLTEVSNKAQELQTQVEELESGLQRQINEYGKATRNMAELSLKVENQSKEIQELKDQLESTKSIDTDKKVEQTKTPVIKRKQSTSKAKKVVKGKTTTTKKKATSRTKKQ